MSDAHKTSGAAGTSSTLPNPVNVICNCAAQSGVSASEQTIWTEYLKFHKEDDEAMVESWREDMDGLLIFAGLYSATLTAFIIESYKLLKQDPGDLTTSLLAQISRQMANVSAPIAQSAEQVPFVAARWSITVNILWFISLLLSLMCALGATLVKQWARDFSQKVRREQEAEKRGKVRALLREGVDRWHLDIIVDSLPTLLHAAVFFFLTGLAVFLRNIDHTVFWAIVATLCVFGLVYASLTFAPLGKGDCPFRTPLSASMQWLAHLVATAADNSIVPFKYSLSVSMAPRFYVDEACHAECDVRLTTNACRRRDQRETDILFWAFDTIPSGTFMRALPAFIGSVRVRAQWDILRGGILDRSGEVLRRKLLSLPTPGERMPPVWACLSAFGAAFTAGGDLGFVSLNTWRYATIRSLFPHIMVGVAGDSTSQTLQHCIRVLGSVVSTIREEFPFGDKIYRVQDNLRNCSDITRRTESMRKSLCDIRDKIPSWHFSHDPLSSAIAKMSTHPDRRAPFNMSDVDGDLGAAIALLSPDTCRIQLLKTHFSFLLTGATTDQHLSFNRTAHYLLQPEGGAFYLRGGDQKGHVGDFSAARLQVVQTVLRQALEVDAALFDRLGMHALFMPSDPDELTDATYWADYDELPCLLTIDSCTDGLLVDLARFMDAHPERTFARDAVTRAESLLRERERSELRDALQDAPDDAPTDTESCAASEEEAHGGARAGAAAHAASPVLAERGHVALTVSPTVVDRTPNTTTPPFLIGSASRARAPETGTVVVGDGAPGMEKDDEQNE